VTVVPLGEGCRVMCNRDEQRARPPAAPPRARQLAAVRAVWPLDPVSGGTWIAGNDAGLLLVLLNRHPRACGKGPGRMSRGIVIPALADLASVEEVVARAEELSSLDLAPFTLVVLRRRQVAVIRTGGRALSVRTGRLVRPLLFTSSSLGDHRVVAPRRELFRRLVGTSGAPLAGQQAFHRHVWATRPDISVRMSRADAATVSRTVVDVQGDRLQMRYTPLAAPVAMHAS
jgi:hypothetical protein